MADKSEYDGFVLACSPALLRTAYLLTCDWAAAEDLLQTALVRAWVAWRRVNGDPMPYVRRVLVNCYTSSWLSRTAMPFGRRCNGCPDGSALSSYSGSSRT